MAWRRIFGSFSGRMTDRIFIDLVFLPHLQKDVAHPLHQGAPHLFANGLWRAAFSLALN